MSKLTFSNRQDLEIKAKEDLLNTYETFSELDISYSKPNNFIVTLLDCNSGKINSDTNSLINQDFDLILKQSKEPFYLKDFIVNKTWSYVKLKSGVDNNYILRFDLTSVGSSLRSNFHVDPRDFYGLNFRKDELSIKLEDKVLTYSK
ncbi:MAG: hypothetical protein ACLFN8_01575 [Candidatus Woesearchaeota archaeon]